MEIPQQALMSPDRLFPKQVPPILLMGQVGKVLGWLQEFGSLSRRKATKEKKKHLKHHGIGTIPESGQGQAAKAVGWLDFPILMDLFTSYAAISWFTRSTAMLWRIVLVC